MRIRDGTVTVNTLYTCIISHICLKVSSIWNFRSRNSDRLHEFCHLFVRVKFENELGSALGLGPREFNELAVDHLGREFCRSKASSEGNLVVDVHHLLGAA